ncbi:adenosylcobinamide-GDP ribazoletransferase [Mariprofundus ferrooxydans]|nr:adenosylcobinamide-GDP ribazoletransferase [Mariprofundus ferrooxydans]
MRNLILAFQFLTRLPMPVLLDVKRDELANSAAWFPVVGLSIGVLLAIAAMLGTYASPWVGGLLVVLMWIAVTGALHLDGAADLADALGASHGRVDDDCESFLAVLKDPHVGSFGVVVLVSIVVIKLVAVAALLEANGESNTTFLLLLVIPAWARLGAVCWGQALNALAPGHGESFSGQRLHQSMWFWGLALFVLSALALSFWFAVVAVFSLFLWGVFLQRRIGGMNGDCLGAGIEYCECAMLLAAVLIL